MYPFRAGWWYAQAEAGNVPGDKVGKFLLFRLSEIEGWLQARRRAPTTKR